MTPARLDLLNIGLMLAALGLACVAPYEVFLAAYAALGPLHYLTEISWLHDRRNFCTRRVDAILLIVPTFFVFLGFGILFKAWHSPFFAAFGPEIMVFTFLSALIYQSVANAWKRILALLLATGATILYSISDGDGYGNLRYWVGLYLPTLIHVFLFTATFILLGALRNRSWTGVASLAVFVLAAGFCFLNPFAALSRAPGSWARTNFEIFAPMNSGLCFLFGLHRSDSTGALFPFRTLEELYASPAAAKAMTFIAFAYLYHYFNWFSKTTVIGWHRISWKRLGLILALWLASTCLYAWSYEAGLLWLAVLSLSHVTLEFPLNWLSFKECASRGAALMGSRNGGRTPVPGFPARNRRYTRPDSITQE